MPLKQTFFACAAATLTTLNTFAVDSVNLEWSPNPGSEYVDGYRIYYSTVSGGPAQLIDAGNTLSTSIPVQEGLTYYITLTAYNIFGLEGAASPEISIEATNPVTSQLVIVEPETGNATGSITAGVFTNPFIGFIETLDPTEAGTASVDFSIPEDATYTSWVRAQVPNANSDSIGMSVNTTVTQSYDLVPSSLEHTADWTWLQVQSSPGVPETFELASGEHTLFFENMGADIIIDRVIFTSDQTFIPTDELLADGEVLIISKHPEGAEAPPGASLTMTVSLLSTFPPSYQWLKDGEPIPNANSSSLSLTALEASDAGDYCVEIQTPSLVTSSETATVVVEIEQLPRVRSFELVAEEASIDLVLSVEGKSGSSIKVMASNDLIIWEDLGTEALDSSGQITVPDPDSHSEPKRFYKVVQSSAPPSS